MKDIETQKQFVHLRSQGWSFARIAQELDVAKATLVRWSRKFHFEINNARAVELEALQVQYLDTREARVRALGEQFTAIKAELARRDLTVLGTARLFSLAAGLRREIIRESGAVTFTLPVTDIPPDELHEQVQDWTA